MHQNILKTIKSDIKEKYYDPKLHNIDIEASAKTAADLISDAKSVEEMDDIIARFLYPFDDSHLFFVPPSKTIKVEYGWEMQFVGDKVFVTSVDEKSDAFKKGLRAGDQIYMVEGYLPVREEFWRFRYHFNLLRPQPSLNVILIKPSGNKYKVDLKAKVIEDNAFMPSTRDLDLQAEREYSDSTKQSFDDKIPGLSIWKMPNFELSQIKLDKMIDKVNKNQSLILDLRGNPGGYISAMYQLASDFFTEKIEVGEVKDRKETRRLVLEPRGKNIFTGKVVVLIDSDSASASEALARIIQIEKRGTVIGDQSSGALMESQMFYHDFGLDTKVPYGLSLTIAEIIMRDGQRLEKVGVTPDEKVLPTALDLANKRDPVLSRAAKILGFELTPEQAGAIFGDKK